MADMWSQCTSKAQAFRGPQLGSAACLLLFTQPSPAEPGFLPPAFSQGLGTGYPRHVSDPARPNWLSSVTQQESGLSASLSLLGNVLIKPLSQLASSQI